MKNNIKFFLLIPCIATILIFNDLYSTHQSNIIHERQNENIIAQKALEQKQLRENKNNNDDDINIGNNENEDSLFDDEAKKSFQKTLAYLDNKDDDNSNSNNGNINTSLIKINDLTDNNNNNNDNNSTQSSYNSVNQYYRQKIVQDAMSFIGVPYVFGGTSPTHGFDCSGFVQYVFRMSGIEIPRSADTQYEKGVSINKNQLIAGDLVFFQTYAAGASHVGIYIGDDKFINATSGGVKIETLNSDYRKSCYYGAKRILDV